MSYDVGVDCFQGDQVVPHRLVPTTARQQWPKLNAFILLMLKAWFEVRET
jgi:hypothetical protein